MTNITRATTWACLILILSWQTAWTQAQAAPGNDQQVLPDIIFNAGNGTRAQAGAQEDMDADNYLQKMRALIQDYNKTVSAAVLGPNGANMDQDGMNAAAAHTQRLANKIAAIQAPRAVAAQHAQLAQSLGAVQNFLQLGGSGAQGLPAALSLSTTVQSAVSNYHQAVLSMIAQRGLSPQLDPFSGESEADKQRALQGINQLQQQFTGGGAADSGTGDLGGALGGNSLGGGLGGSGLDGNALGGLGGLGGALGGGQGENGVDGAMGGSGLGGNGLGGAMGGSGLGGNGLGGGLGSGTTGGAAPNLGVLMQGLMGGTTGGGAGATPDMSNFLKNIDPQTLNSLMHGGAGAGPGTEPGTTPNPDLENGIGH